MRVAMSGLGASRFTALLAAIAICGMAGTFLWALETRSEMKAAAANRAADRNVPAKLGGRVAHDQSRRPDPNKYGANKFELMGTSERAPDQDLDRHASLASNPVGAAPNPGSTPLATQGRGVALPDTEIRGSPRGHADMPLPVLLAPAPAQPDPVQTKFADPPAPVAPVPAPQQPAEHPKRQARAAAPNRGQPSYYMEKYFEQGEYHYRRRRCDPPNMPDVCFMPQADRQPIVVAKP
jgi:hypothetical protein